MTLNGHSVLVVEDDQEINHLVGAYVQLCGYEYRAALNGVRALEEAHARKPALVILDLMLPDVDGFEVCRRLKSADDTRNVPVVMLTALPGEANRQKGMACGASAYLTKPFVPEQLMKTIETYAKNHPSS
jgi:DNA-binding response OmpR family regulator